MAKMGMLCAYPRRKVKSALKKFVKRIRANGFRGKISRTKQSVCIYTTRGRARMLFGFGRPSKHGYGVRPIGRKSRKK